MSRKRSSKALKPNASAATVKPTRDSFTNFSAKLGYGAGSIQDGSTYQVDYISRDRQKLDSMYRSSWICGKAVDVVADDMCKRGIDVQSDEIDPGQIDLLMKSWKTLGIWDKLSDTIKWGRLYGGALAVILIDGQKFDTPLRLETVAKDQFKGLMALDRWVVQPSLERLVKELGPHFGQPEFYSVIADSLALPNMRIHHSRVIRIDGQDLPYWQRIAENLWGQSILERLFDRLVAFDSTTAGSAQLVHKAHLRTMKVKGFREIVAMGGPPLEGLKKSIEFIRQTQTNEGLTVLDADDEFDTHQYSFSGLDTLLLQFGQQLSGAVEIPLTRLFGQSPAGLNATGESDLITYYDGINQQQERRLRAGVSLLLAISYRSKFGQDLPESADFTFRPLWQLTDEQKATIASGLTSAITSASTSGVVGRQTALKELRQSSRITGIWSNITDEEIEAADNDVDLGEFGPGPGGEDEDAGDDEIEEKRAA